MMSTTLHLEAIILPGHRLEISDPGLPEGATVEVTVIVPPETGKPKISMLDFLSTLPPGPLLFNTPTDVKDYLDEDRNSWER